MAAISWPASLPTGPQAEGYNRAPVDNSIESDIDVGGLVMKRRRFSASVDIVSVSYYMTAAQRAAFDTFFRTTSYQGTLRFNWTDPQDAATRDAQFVKGSVQIQPDGWEFRVSFQLRVFI